jgi:hypothetical protein
MTSTGQEYVGEGGVGGNTAGRGGKSGDAGADDEACPRQTITRCNRGTNLPPSSLPYPYPYPYLSPLS